jgi:fructokinase
MSDSAPLLGGIELGGTKCVCLIGTGPNDVRMRTAIPTGSDSADTLRHLEEELRRGMAAHGPIRALGIASFGPIDLDRNSPTYGWITSTPKPGWRRTSVTARFLALDLPLAFDTDVNGAALAEGCWGAARGLADFAYITVGTGIGVGLYVNGGLTHGFLHPELGHLRIARLPGDRWPGSCPFHGDCVEGLASGPAIAARSGMEAHLVPLQDPVWVTVAHALAQLLHALVVTTAPRRILIGGGIMGARPELLALVRRQLADSLSGYIDRPEVGEDIDRFIAAPGLGALAGPLGALALAANALAANAPGVEARGVEAPCPPRRRRAIVPANPNDPER